MANAYGHDSYIAFAEETTYGTEAIGTYKFLHFDRGGDQADQKVNWIDSTAVGMVGQAITMSSQGTRDARGSVTFEMPYCGMERLLKHALGNGLADDTPYAGDTITNRFVYDPQDDLSNILHGLPGSSSGKVALTIKLIRGVVGGRTWVYTGAHITEIQFTLQKHGLLKCKVTFVAQNFSDEATGDVGAVTINNKGFHSYYNLSTASPNSGLFRWNNNVIPIETWSLTYKNKLDEDRYWFSGMTASGTPTPTTSKGVRQDPVRKNKIEVTSKFTAELRDTDVASGGLYDDFQNQTARQMSMSFIGKAITGSQSGANYALSFLTGLGSGNNQARITSYPVKAADEGLIRVDAEVKHYRDAAETVPTYVSATLGTTKRELRIVVENDEPISAL